MPDRYYGIFNDSFPPILDGVALAVENYAHWLNVHGKKPCVVTPWNPRHTERDYKIIKFLSIPIIGRSPYRLGIPQVDPFIRRKIRNTDMFLAHSHCPFSSGHLALYAKKVHDIPLIGTFHSKYRDDLQQWFSHSPGIVKSVMHNILEFFNACDHVWIPQAMVEETIREYGYNGKLTVVENGNDFADIKEKDLASFREESRKHCNIPADTLSLLFVGQHIWEKGVDVIMDALFKIRNDIDFTMTFVGIGYALNDLKKMAKERGMEDRIRFLGAIDNREQLKRIYAAADLFLFPSFYDNAPLVIREAAAMGTASVLPTGSTSAEVISDGNSGYLTSKNPEAYASMLRYAADHRKDIERTGLGARRNLVRSWENVVEEVEQRYADIIDEYRKR